ncbi:MAG: hypothetical protein AB8B60_20745 [Sulfitobacter sp.]
MPKVNAKTMALGLALSTFLFPFSSQAGPITDFASEAEQLLEDGDAAAALERLSKATELVWNASPLIVQKALFAESATGYGLYVEREAGSTFKQGEKLLIYVEPVGYGYGRNGVGNLAVGFDVDFILTDTDNKTMFSKEDFAKVSSPLRYKNREFFLNLTVNLTGFPAGDYISNFRLRDQNSDKSATFKLPFTVNE